MAEQNVYLIKFEFSIGLLFGLRNQVECDKIAWRIGILFLEESMENLVT